MPGLPVVVAALGSWLRLPSGDGGHPRLLQRSAVDGRRRGPLPRGDLPRRPLFLGNLRHRAKADPQPAAGSQGHEITSPASAPCLPTKGERCSFEAISTLLERMGRRLSGQIGDCAGC